LIVMTLLRPTPSRRRWLARFPLWTVVVAVALGALLLVGLALLFGLDDGDDSSDVAARPCTDGETVDVDVEGEGAGGPATPPKKGGPVNVLNATDRIGLAAETAAEIDERGFQIGAVTNAPKGTTVEAAAQVRYGPGSVDWARWVAAHVPGAELVPDTRTSPDVDLVLGDAYDRTVGEKKALAAYAESGEAAETC
jgi:hypothetical protein